MASTDDRGLPTTYVSRLTDSDFRDDRLWEADFHRGKAGGLSPSAIDAALPADLCVPCALRRPGLPRNRSRPSLGRSAGGTGASKSAPRPMAVSTGVGCVQQRRTPPR